LQLSLCSLFSSLRQFVVGFRYFVHHSAGVRVVKRFGDGAASSARSRQRSALSTIAAWQTRVAVMKTT
jgi:hypothetical protein